MKTRTEFSTTPVKNTTSGMMVVVMIVCLIFISALQNGIKAQTATATWALTSNSSVVVAGNITATNHSFGAGLTSTSYNATNGSQAANFNGSICNPNFNDYFEFNITASCGSDLTINSITFDYRASSITTSRCLQLIYAINGGTETQIGSNITVSSTTPTPYTTGPISIAIPQGQSIRLRIYGAANSTAVSLATRNFVVNGTTVNSPGPVPSINITADPSGPICPGAVVTFSASQFNGGSAPSYQWQINGFNAGTNSPGFSSGSLLDGDQVTCILTSNLTCAFPTSVTSNAIIISYLPLTIPTPGPITGPIVVNIYTSGLGYGIAAVPGAISYVWTVPAGWAITSGQGTTGVTVTSGDAGSGGNITVAAANACITGSASILAITMIPPHNNCNECHISHTSPGMLLTNTLGNANLCMSCHNSNGVANLDPFSNAMKAVPGVSGNSHNWDVNAINPLWETNTPSNPDMAARLPNGQIICSTCHNQHNPIVYPKYLRASNTGDAICKDCHSARNVGTYASNNSNKGSHPVGVDFNPSDPRFLSTPTGPFGYIDSKVECSSCHQPHYAVSNDGNLLRGTNNDALCANCHVYKSADITLDHEGMGCKTCHYTHSVDKSNIMMVRNTIQTPNSGLQSVVFTGLTGPGNFADGSAPFNGVCEVCHTNTDHYTNTSGGTSDARHNPASQSCISCHQHSKAFYATTNCLDCHNSITDKPGVGPIGGRRQIVDNTGNGFGTGGDFKRFTHHVNSVVPTTDDCIKCHFMGDHMNGTVKLLDPDQGFLNIIAYDPLVPSSIETFCINCHDANGSNGDMTPFSDNISVPPVDGSMWTNSAHKASLSCISCHDNGHGSNKNNLLAPYNYTGSGTGSDLTNEEEGFCLGCHGSGGSATVKVHLAFSSYTNNSTDFYKHDPAAQYRIHNANEIDPASFGGANRHIECVDCHNPHAVKAGTATAPVLLPTLTGVTGVEPVYAGAGAPTGFTWQSSVSAEYQVCYKCHSSYTTLPTYLPSGWDGSALVPDGLKKLTTGGINGQIADNRDMAQEFNPNNNSYHPVMAVGKNAGINATTFQSGWSSNSRMYCTSCHNNPRAATAGQGRGPHGSQNLHLLDQATPGTAAVNYKTYHNSTLANSNDVCGKCHTTPSYWTQDNQGSRYPYHATHIDGEQAECYICHDSHGSEQFHNINFNRNVPGCLTSVTTTTQNAFAHATGTITNSCTITCHNAGHTGSSRTYNPAYN